MLNNEKNFSIIQEYSKALELLDNYDHQVVTKPEGLKKDTYQLTYEECRELIASMSFGLSSTIFGHEKSEGALKGIVDSIYQSAFGEDAYPTVEEKAANLLYFIVKDHPFIDGCKRIAATIFIYFLNQNNLLFRNGEKIISDSSLVAITLLLAESKPEEKEMMVKVVMNFLGW
ncbi:Fic family protein [Fusobacterium polymorphum]|uniref:type II toxin-antitoxin system death-on-curing family toxin n=1 Tax=Fusobacterium nucleatum subsp. polymorphum TaxID=76857 RepID=UPI0030097DAF